MRVKRRGYNLYCNCKFKSSLRLDSEFNSQTNTIPPSNTTHLPQLHVPPTASTKLPTHHKDGETLTRPQRSNMSGWPALSLPHEGFNWPMFFVSSLVPLSPTYPQTAPQAPARRHLQPTSPLPIQPSRCRLTPSQQSGAHARLLHTRSSYSVCPCAFRVQYPW